jgi:hypothetical protein
VVALPSDDQLCDLTATKNIFGRMVNGVTESNVCYSDAVKESVTGEFIQAEQNSLFAGPTRYANWRNALFVVFTPICKPGMVVNPGTSLCVTPPPPAPLVNNVV